MTNGPRGWKILVATDGSKSAERAVAAAARMPWPEGSEVKVITVVDPLEGMPETIAARRARDEQVAADARARIEKAGRKVSSVVALGSPARTILAAASEWGAGVIVVGARGLGAVRGLLLGSVSSAVARAAASSVLVVKSDIRMPIRALMAVDGSGDARGAARRLAEVRAPGNAVTVVRVIEPLRVKTLNLLPRRIADPLRAEVARAAEEQRKSAERDAREVAGLFRDAGWKAEAAVRSGVPTDEVLAAARKGSASLVGVGPRGVTGLERILLGSVTERLLVAPGISLFIGR
jgi:nucleotide-binding universal stress UspA family protein